MKGSFLFQRFQSVVSRSIVSGSVVRQNIVVENTWKNKVVYLMVTRKQRKKRDQHSNIPFKSVSPMLCSTAHLKVPPATRNPSEYLRSKLYLLAM